MKAHSQLLKILKAKSTKLCPALLGPHGIGKNHTVESVAKELGLEVLTMNLSAIESIDFTGRQYVDENKVTRWARPEFLNFTGILFLDEITRVSDSSVKACLHSLLLDRKINSHDLNPETKIVLAGNVGENYEVFDLDLSLKDRIIEIDMAENDLESWSVFEKQSRPSPLVDFILDNPSLAEKFSFRRLTEANKFYLETKSIECLELFLNASLVDLFNKSTHEKQLCVNDILNGTASDLSNVNKMRLVNIAHDLSSMVISGKAKSKTELDNIQDFLTKIDNESRLAFFSDLKKASETLQPDSFGKMVESLKKAKFFSGELKQYLLVIFEDS
jgi:hypothetical protein